MALMGVEALARRLDDPDVRVADVRWYLGRPGSGRAAYDAGHIPGAVFVGLEADLSAPHGAGRHPLPDPADLAARLGQLGFGSRHAIVAYDDVGGANAARLWWMLDTLGHADVAVLDGGLSAWTAAGLPLATDEPAHRPATLALAHAWTRVIGRDDLRGRLGTLRLLDARAAERYRGEVEPVDPAAGHIPTAVSAPATANLGPDGRFLPPDVLAARFTALGCAGADVVTSCGSGVTACHNALAMRIAGLPDPTLYPGSFSDWSRAGLPVAAGPESGEPT